MIYVVFDDDVNLYFARSRVLERMSLVTKTLPSGVTPIWPLLSPSICACTALGGQGVPAAPGLSSP